MPFLRASLLAAAVSLVGAGAAQATSLPLDPLGLQIGGQPAANVIVWPGDQIGLTQTLLNSVPGSGSTLTGVTGALTPQTSGVTMGTATSAFPDAAFGATTANATPFTATVPAGLECGQNVDFNLHVAADQGTANMPVTVGTGVAGPVTSASSSDVPQPTANSTIDSKLVVTQTGRVKDIHVDLGQLSHTYDGDLRIWIEAPDGTTVDLADNEGGNGHDFTGTVFGSSGPSLALGAAPFTGSFRADGDLSAFVGHRMQGTWILHIQDQLPGNTGTLVSWGLGIAAATCSSKPVIASFTANPNPAQPGDTVQFDASASAAHNGSITDYAWDLDGNGTYETDTHTTPTVSHVYPADGEFPVGLRVTDSQSHVDFKTVSLVVGTPPVPVLHWSPVAPLSGQQVTLDASGSSASQGTIADYAWDLDGDGTFETDTGATATAPVTFAHAGVHTVRVRVTDGAGAMAVRAADIVVLDRPPTAVLSLPPVPVAGLGVPLDASGSTDPDGTIVRYEWDLDGDGIFELDTGATPTTSAGPWPFGPQTVSVRVTDDQGATDVATVNSVVDAPPVPALSIGPNPAVTGAPVALSAVGSADPDGSITDYAWDLDGNGTFETDTATTATLDHTYETAGSRDVGLRVTDDRGVTSTAAVPLVVNQAPAGGGTGPTTPPGGGGGPTGPTGPSGPTGPTGPTTPPPTAFSAGLLGAPIQALRLARSHGVTLRCHVAAAATCTLLAYLPAKESRRLHLARASRHLRSKLVGRAVVQARPGADGRVVLALSAPLRRALAHARSSRLLVRATAVDALGRRVTMARVVLLRR